MPKTEKDVEETAAPAPPAEEKLAKMEIPPVITKAEEYDRVYRYLQKLYHVLTPITAFSGMAPQHGLVVAKVLIDSDPQHGEVYQDKMFCRTGSRDPMDDEVAIAKVGLRKLALAGGWNLSAQVLKAERNYWLIRASNRFVGIDGSVQNLSATEEYDLRDGSPQVRNMTQKQLESARAHGLRGGEARALNAASREYGIKQKYTRRELNKAFVVMRMMFIPDATNELQMRLVTERALAGTTAMYPQASNPQVIELEPIDGMEQGVPIVEGTATAVPPAVAQEPTKPVEDIGVRLPPGFVLIRSIEEKPMNRKPPKTGTFTKWIVIDSNGEQHSTIKKDFAAACRSCWNEADWKKGRPVEIISQRNTWNENDITEINPLPQDDEEEPSISVHD